MGIQTVISAFWRLVRFHLGTAAFGSFIIALIQLVRIILAYIEHLVKKYEARINFEISEFYNGPILQKKGFGAAGKVALVILKAVLACLQCILACFERFMKFINVNAYIETAIYGYNFCRAAMKAFKLLVRNVKTRTFSFDQLTTITDGKCSQSGSNKLNRNFCFVPR